LQGIFDQKPSHHQSNPPNPTDIGQQGSQPLVLLFPFQDNSSWDKGF